MAYFKISLLTPRYKNSDIYFTQDIITQWDSPVKSHNQELSFNIHSLTYNEKFTKHQNGQKELTFSMNKHIVRQDEWFDNPFCNLIAIGTQLLLEDQYHNHYIFTVTNIKFNFKENNVIYDVSCQDSFSYQLTRQNNGYEIVNDSSSEDFIGAKTLDWWVTQKIAKECYLYNYTYIPLFKGFYKTITNDVSTIYTSMPDNVTDVAEIIKEIYSTEKDKDYYETIPFSCSGVSAAGALIALGDILNMQLVVFEHIENSGRVLRYFWFEPKKNDKRVNLTYSPSKDIQNFGLSHKGESLTTILNVTGPTYDDELITLIPSIPSFWASYIESKEWKTSTYSPGFFSTLYKSTDIILNITDSHDLPAWLDGHYDIAINSNLLYHTYYNKFEFEENSTVLTLSTGDHLYSKYSTFLLVRTVNGVETVYHEHDKLPIDPIEGESWVIRILYPSSEQGPGITTAYICITFYRDYTNAEEDFARAADACPWLENKIIDFTYFYNNNIISKQEYQDLNDLFNNKLRIINGQLLWYSQAHYNAIHYQTKLIADLTNKIDLLGATFEADFVSPLADHGALATDINDFTNAYNNVFGSFHPGEGKSLINLDDLKEEYATKYFNAQQRFLKNLYNFRNYFEQPTNLYNTNIYKHELKILSLHPSNAEYAFDAVALQRVDNNFDLVDNQTKKPYVELYQQLDGQIKPQKIAYKYQSGLYTTDLTEPVWSAPKSSTDIYNSKTIYADNNYNILSRETIIKNYLNTHSPQNNWFIYSHDYIYRDMNNISDILDDLYNIMKSEILLGSLNSIGRELSYVDEDVLKQYLPLNTIYRKVPQYNIQEKDGSYYWYRLNKKGETVLDYLNYKEKMADPERTIENLIEVKNPWDEDQLVYMPFDFTTPDNEPCKYRLVRNYYQASSWSWIAAFLTRNVFAIVALAVLSATLYNVSWSTTGEPAYHVDGTQSHESKKWLASYLYYVTDTSWADNRKIYIDSFEKAKTAIDAAHFTYPATLEDIKTENYFNGAWYRNHIGTSDSDPDTFNLETTISGYPSFKYDLEQKSFSYMLGSSSGFKYRCNEYHLLRREDPLYSNGSYYVCCIAIGESTVYKKLEDFKAWLVPSGTPKVLDDVAYYPLTTRFVRLDSIAEKDNGRTLQSIIQERYGNNGSWDSNGYYIYRYLQNSTEIKLIFFKQEMYERIPASSLIPNLGDYYQELYDTNTNALVNYDKIPGLVQGLYELMVPERTIYIPVNWSDPEWNYSTDPTNWDNKWLNTKFYTYDTTQKEYVQVYNIEQIKHNSSLLFNYIRSTIKEEELFIDKPGSYSFGIIEYNKQDNSIHTINKFVTINDWTKNGNIYYCDYNDDIRIRLTITLEEQISTRTNGEFWNKYHNAVDRPILMQQAIGIETQLTEYWTSAYTASKYCEYFIPENWHPISISDINYFKVITTDAQGKVTLSTQYVPYINILINEGHNFDLPRYIFKRSITSRGATPNTEEEFKDTVVYHTSSQLNNIVIKQAFDTLGEDINSWVFEEIGKTKYYYVDKDGGGTTWTNLTSQYNQQFSEFSGWYIMFYKVLSTYTKQDESRYYDLLQEHNNFWAEMYRRYGYLLLENVYTNEDATTSADLLKMAQLYFKDLNAPERAYNITVIDTASLMNYNGAEIRLGDGIQIKANEFYSEYDDIYQSLSQVLFVSDIGYTLRNVTDISLTVNDIKYSDKMIQRLAKLLR